MSQLATFLEAASLVHDRPEQQVSLIKTTSKNRSPYQRLDWVKTSIPFPMGAVPKAEGLNEYTTPNGICDLELLKKHPDGSVAIALLRHAEKFQIYEEKEVPVFKGPRAEFGFAPGQKIAEWVKSPHFYTDVLWKVKFVGDPDTYYAGFDLLNAGVVSQGRAHVTIRLRSHFVSLGLGPKNAHPLSLTTYLTFESFTNNASVIFVIGNDTLERPIPGGIKIESLEILLKPPVRLEFYQPNQWGMSDWNQLIPGFWSRSVPMSSQDLADGQTIAFRGRLTCEDTDPSSIYWNSFLASVSDPLYGICDYASWKNSRSLGLTGLIPEPKFLEVQTPVVRLMLEGQANFPYQGDVFSWFGLINQNPAGTGDQPDFGATAPVFAQQCIQAGTSAPLLSAIVQGDREALRPTYYWKTEGNLESRVKIVDFPELFFWNGRPHFDFSWNEKYPAWKSRTNQAQDMAFNPGDFHGWSAMDNQHASHNHLRALYELTGDMYYQDILRYNLSTLYWNYFTGWFHNVEAERCGRIMKEALALCLLFPDVPESLRLKGKLVEKNKDVFLQRLRIEIPAHGYGVATVSLFDSCDPRVMGGRQCNPQNPNIIVAGWQTGFHLEFQAKLHELGWDTQTTGEILKSYLDSYEFYFLPNGEPITYFLVTDPKTFETGGIGIYWWAGWLRAASVLPNHPSSQKIQDSTAGLLKAELDRIRSGKFWSDQDRWRL